MGKNPPSAGANRSDGSAITYDDGIRRKRLALVVGVAVTLAALVVAWSFALATGEAALDECTWSAPGAGVTVTTDFDGWWTWTCVYESGPTQFERPGPSVGDFLRRVVG